MGAPAAVFPAWTVADWRRAAEAALKGASLETLASWTSDGVRIEPLYAPSDGPRAERGEGPWRVVARLDHPLAGDANAQALDDLAGGADGLQVVFSGALGAYGFGLGRFDSATLHTAFEGVRFDAGQRFELDLGPSGPDEARSFAGLVERSGVRPADCAVSFGLDPFASCARAAFSADWRAQARPYVAAALALRAKGFRGPQMVADARPVHAAGGTVSQELAFALGAGVALLRALSEAGLPLEEARAMIAFRLAADADQLATLAKFRAMRLAWARAEEVCGLKLRTPMLQAETAWRMMTARDPYVNVMRAAIAALSAGLGGADSVSVLPHTLAIGLPDGPARRLARTGQLILLRESHLGFVTDPAAGAGAFEAVTSAFCGTSWAEFQRLEGEGGLPRALASGALQRRVVESAAALKRQVARLKSPITGVSVHPDLVENLPEAAPGAPERERAAFEEGALAPLRLAEPFEALRDASDAILRTVGSRPKVYLAAIGPEASYRRVVAFAQQWLEAGGLEPVSDGEAGTPEAAVGRLKASHARVACLCPAEDIDFARVQAFAEAIKAAGARSLSLVGRPTEREAELRAAGIDDFIFAGADALASLRRIHRCTATSASTPQD